MVQAKMTDKIVVLVTCGSVEEGKRIGRALVEARLAACVNVVQAPIASIYRWKGRVDAATEFLMIIKSSRQRFPALQEAVKRLHSYEIPEIISLPIERGSRDYMAWLTLSVQSKR
jgi:periplasmic divalent cation tolerance protein